LFGQVVRGRTPVQWTWPNDWTRVLRTRVQSETWYYDTSPIVEFFNIKNIYYNYIKIIIYINIYIIYSRKYKYKPMQP
jgi:hypothetical protein